MTCTTDLQRWSIDAPPTAGEFEGGRAAVSISMTDVPSGVAPTDASRSVKLVALPPP